MSWETQLSMLVQYKTNHGDCNIPTRQGQLGMWVNTQRANYKKNKLSQDRIDRLNDIGFVWAQRSGNSRKRQAPKRSRLSQESSSRQMRATSLSTNVEPPSVESGNEPNWFKGTGFDSEPSVPLRITKKI